MTNSIIYAGALIHELDVAIVGAGASGIYSAHRLMHSSVNNTQNLMVFDLSDRIGGRLFSKKLDGMDYYSELGGMRYITSQHLITSLIEGANSPIYKKVTPIAFPMGTDGSKLITNLRGQIFYQNDFIQKQQEGKRLIVNYNLRDEDQGLSADQLFSKVIYLVLAQSKWFIKKYRHCICKVSEFEYEIKLNHIQWLDVKNNLTYDFSDTPYTAKKVNDIGFWNLIKDVIGQEGYNYLAEAGGYYSNTINWNAAEAFEYMIGDFSQNVKYKTLYEGFNKVILELAQAVDPSLAIETDGTVKNISDGNKIKMYHRLNAIAKINESQIPHYLQNYDRRGRVIDPDMNLLSSIQEKSNLIYILTFDILDENGNATDWIRVRAEKVILGMPRRSLELLLPDNSDFFYAANAHHSSPITFDTAYRSIIKEPAYKLIMVYAEAWWKKLLIHSGHSITDLPMRQCYYFPSNKDFKASNHLNDTSNNAPENAVLLSSYGDMVTESFWKPMSDQPLNTEAYGLTASNEKDVNPESKHYEVLPVGSSFVKEAQKQLKELHGTSAISDPYKVYFKDWTDDPFGAGYHAWKATANVPQTRLFMRDIFNDSTFHIVGESYSTQQGWVEGAFFEAERVMKDHFQLDIPSWFIVADESENSYYEYMYPENY